MSAQAIWRAADGLSKQKTMRLIWPELAAALDGGAVSGARSEAASAPAAPEQPRCGECRTRWARIELRTHEKLCAYCLGKVPEAARRGLISHPEWTRVGDVSRER